MQQRHQWTPRQDTILRAHYASEGGGVAERIPGVSASQCKTRAWHLGLSFAGDRGMAMRRVNAATSTQKYQFEALLACWPLPVRRDGAA